VEKGIKERFNSEIRGELVSNLPIDASQKGLVCILLVLAVIAGSLFTIFSFVSTAQVDEALDVVLFLTVVGLLVVGYMVGLMFLGLLIVPVAKLVRSWRDQRSVKKPI